MKRKTRRAAAAAEACPGKTGLKSPAKVLWNNGLGSRSALAPARLGCAFETAAGGFHPADPTAQSHAHAAL